MIDINFHRELYALFNNNVNVVIEKTFIEFFKPEEKVEQFFTTHNVEFDRIGENTLRIEKQNLNIKIFKSISDFNKSPSIKEDSNILILEDPAISYTNSNTYSNFILDSQDNLFTNANAYFEFQKFLKDLEKESDDSFHFVDSYSQDHRKLTFVSLSDVRRLTIKYNREIPAFNRKVNHSIALAKFKDSFNKDNRNFPKFLKSSFISTASSYPEETRFKDLFEALDVVIGKAKVNFEVFLNNLSIESIKNDYHELKTKYFSTLSGLLSKLTNKVIALPVGISATLYAIAKIGTEPFFLLFLISSLVITTLYLCCILKIHDRDLNNIKTVFLTEYEMLKENNFFRVHPEELKLFKTIKASIFERVQTLKRLIEAYYWILNISNLVLVGYMVSTLGVNIEGTCLMSLIAIVFVAVLRNYIITREI